MRGKLVGRALTVLGFAGQASVSLAGVDPWADRVVSFDPGLDGLAAYRDESSVLGAPERFTGEGVYPSAVTMFNPAFGTDELVSIGAGGELTVEFDPPVRDDPAHPFGVDLIVFGNSFFIDVDFPNGQIGDPVGVFSADAMRVLVSADGEEFVPLGVMGDTLFPVQGYLDVPPQSGAPGSVPTNFLRPIDPALRLDDFAGLSYAEALALYGGSGGGAPIDIRPSGLFEVRFVRIEAVSAGFPVEIDALAAVPEPTALMLAASVLLAGSAFRRKR